MDERAAPDAERHQREGQRGLRAGEVLADHLRLGSCDPLRPLRVAPTSSRRCAAEMNEFCVGHEACLPAELARAPEKIDVLGVHEPLLGEAPQGLPDVVADGHDGSRCRLDRPRVAVVPVRAQRRLEVVRHEARETGGADELGEGGARWDDARLDHPW